MWCTCKRCDAPHAWHLPSSRLITCSRIPRHPRPRYVIFPPFQFGFLLPKWLYIAFFAPSFDSRIFMRASNFLAGFLSPLLSIRPFDNDSAIHSLAAFLLSWLFSHCRLTAKDLSRRSMPSELSQSHATRSLIPRAIAIFLTLSFSLSYMCDSRSGRGLPNSISISVCRIRRRRTPWQVLLHALRLSTSDGLTENGVPHTSHLIVKGIKILPLAVDGCLSRAYRGKWERQQLYDSGFPSSTLICPRHRYYSTEVLVMDIEHKRAHYDHECQFANITVGTV